MKKVLVLFFLSMCLSLGAQEEAELQEELLQQEEAELWEETEQQEIPQHQEEFDQQEASEQQEGVKEEETAGYQDESEPQEDIEQNDIPEINGDLDALFEDPSIVEFEAPTETQDKGPISLRDKITLDINYGLNLGLSPGWSEAPWSDNDAEYSYVQGIKLDARLTLDIPFTEHLRAHNVFYLAVPEDEFFSIKEFYFEYNFGDKAYLQAGLYETAWGISRFYPFTNLPARTPRADSKSKTPGNSYIARLVIPIGIGGLELIGMTRYGYMEETSSPALDEMSFGMKYNLALEGIDIDAGFLYHQVWPVRSFMSVKTTIGDTEVYAEGLIAAYREDDRTIYISGNFGFVHEFFNRKLTLNGEVFYNGEPAAAWWRPASSLLEGSTVNFYKGLNSAMAFVFRPGVLGMRIFARTLYTYEEQSVWLVPGISIKPGDLTITLSVPMALGKRTADGSNYYSKNDDKRNRPFSIILGFTFSGRMRYTL